ncbi:zinc-binding alcohol dehydrogenase [Candidatus Poribacteria bacterium]|nr:zinc-binding alcohol dehydrogenase [Candidatus Poribacteria bacterium]
MAEGRRIVVRSDGRIEVEAYDIPSPGRGQVLIETICTAVSAGTELGVQEQARSGDYHPGYSNVGRIVECGAGVDGFSPGDRVLSFGNHASHVVSGTDSPYLIPVPDDVGSDEGAFGVIGSVSMHGARKANAALGEHVLVTGVGMVGQIVVQLLARTGAETLIAMDLSSFRLEVALQHGATHTLDARASDTADAIRDLTHGRGIDVAVEASGYPDVIPSLVDYSRIGGRIVLLGSIWHRPVTLDLMPFHEKEITMMGCHQPKCPPKGNSYYPWSQEYNRRTFLHWIADGRLRIADLITHRLAADDAPTAYQLLREERDRALGVLFAF